ncbi:MAG: RNA-binding domain-containing protein [bacterium]
MNEKEILEILKNGENSKVEFKDERVGTSELARIIVAFVNSEGGIIFLGVDDNGIPLGITRKKIEEWVMEVGRNNCYPSIIPIFERKTIDGKSIAIVTIRKGEGMVYRTSDGHYYIRVGSTVRDATPDELARMFQRREMVHYDTAPIYNASLKDLNQDRLKDYFSQVLHRKDYKKSLRLLGNINVMTRVEDKYYPTIAGLLMFGKSPETILPQAGIISVQFPEDEMDYDMRAKKEIGGPLIELIEEAIEFVMTHTSSSSKLKGIRRKDRPQYPKESIREAIVNAVAHRDYSISGSKIRLLIFKNRVEIHSPGRLPNTVTIENMKETAHYTRNPIIYKFLAQYGYAEDIGLGIPQKIIERMLEHNGKEPKLEESGEEFILTLFG